MPEADESPERGIVSAIAARALFALKHLLTWCVLALVAYCQSLFATAEFRHLD